MSHTDRVVVLVDMDCFYCQVEENLNLSLKGKPLAVVQYNAWKGGGIIAVNYAARDRGVTRHMRGDEAKQKCPEIELVQVPNVRGKADLTKYREAGKLVANVLQSFTGLLERASVDEAYLDITEAVAQRRDSSKGEIQLNQIKNTHVAASTNMDFLYNLYSSGLCDENNLKLAYGAVIVEEIRAAVFEQTGYTCSAGIAHNKILAKLACGLNKPNKQTILTNDNVQQLFENLPVQKIRSLGGKFGASLSEDLGVATMGELSKVSEKELRKRYDEKTASFLFNIARGIDLEPVKTRLVSKSIGCCKTFPGKNALLTAESITHWVHELAEEISERLQKDFEENNRKAKQISIVFSQEVNGKDVSNSRVHPLTSHDVEKIAQDTFGVIKKNCMKPNGSFCVKYLGIHASKFEECRKVNAITSFFKVGVAKNERNSVVETKPEDNVLDSTVELDENSSDLIFLNEKDVDGNASKDSISNEIRTEQSDKKESFFLQYFENLRKSKSPVKRDFNTSRILEESVEEEAMPGTSTTEDAEVCEECSESIPVSEMATHKDFHFALKLNQEESLNRKTVAATTTKNKDSGIKPKKRKSHDMPHNSLTKFLKNNYADESIGNVRLCSECNRNIPENEFASHLDYHMAKRIHLEMNPVKSAPISEKNAINSAKKGKKGKTSSGSSKNLTAFFKPVS
ncbi:hypothetical protein RN001_015221 [Aquatica leii]|uniref:DNA polymerase eta n=1 Tax=Aquatica leii TaxID=1421715 RepID=A0AAN7NYS8_9COLE|nr:hypothetical protein RN001_015221 [Aquatica leii]